eukprot:TRINITY_DN12653_c0_g1_i1.p1 TRINITY_DN12653_c0_g1~~TRINITY_DN12653_c0_g1_i1.p1  ORF type:complete len:264 (+),score=44.51 TRINITY_DN12653_c0_g1_i1:301-1092(+)
MNESMPLLRQYVHKKGANDDNFLHQRHSNNDINEIVALDNQFNEIFLKMKNKSTIKEFNKLKLKFSLLINKEMVYTNTKYWWDKHIKEIFIHFIRKSLEELNEIDQSIQILRFVSKKFQEVADNTLVDSCFKILEFLKQNNYEQTKMQKYIYIMNEDTLRECYNEEMLKDYHYKYTVILKELGEYYLKSKKHDRAMHQYIGSWEISRRFNNNTNQCMIYKPLTNIIHSCFLAKNMLNVEKKKKSTKELLISKKIKQQSQILRK